MKFLSAFFSGVLFSIGLVLSGMTHPENVIGFLDFFGNWKPALAFVMAGAVGVYAALYPAVSKKQMPLFDRSFNIPSIRDIDTQLIVGAVVFGIGWGIGGFCPGPSLVSLGTGAKEVLIFFLAMLAGMFLYRIIKSANTSEARNGMCG